MPTSRQPPQLRTRPFVVRMASVVAMGPLALLVVAGSLSPNRTGMGTHRQLGLPPCSIRLLFGIRCPACGMTTSWSHFARGDLLASAQASAGGFLLAVMAVALAGFAVRSVWLAQFPSQPARRAIGWAAIAMGGVIMIDWAIRVW